MKKIYPPKILSKNNSQKFRRVYLDYASTTPICKEVKDAMKKVEEVFENPSSLYASGVKTKKILEDARHDVAQVLSAQSKEIIFTSGGTEGNNMIIFGLYNYFVNEGSSFFSTEKKLHIVTSTIEHSSVLEPIRELEKRGLAVTYIKPNSDGLIDPREIKKVLRPETILVSIIYANNEIGTIQAIREIAKVIRGYKKILNLSAISSKPLALSFPLFHTDACQASNYLSLNTLLLGVDFMTLDGGKIYGPKGSGVVFRKTTAPLLPVMFGGGQEKELRSGTENISLIIGFSKALSIADKMKEKETLRLSKLQKYFFDHVLKKIPEASINGSKDSRLPNNINICIPNLDAEFAVFGLDKEGIECSATSACMSLKDNSGSYVIEEVSGLKCSKSSLRFSLGRYTKKSDIDYCLKTLSRVLLNQWNISINNK